MQKNIKNLLERSSLFIAIGITLLIAYLSLSKPVQLNLEITFLDKILHLVAYFTLTVSWLFALKDYSNNKIIFIGLFLYGVLMEFLQGWLTTYREKDILDVIANTVGVLIAMLVFNKLLKYYVKIFDN